MAQLIGTETIGHNPYAPTEAADVRLYQFNGCEHLTLGQLVNAVCCRVGAVLEQQTVNKSNVITAETDLLNAYSEVISVLATNDTVKPEERKITVPGAYAGMTFKEFLKSQDIKYVDSDFETTPGRIALTNRLRLTVEPLTNTSQKDMIDLQTCISRRDVAYATATNSVRALGTALQGTAANF